MEVYVQKQKGGSRGGYPRAGENCRGYVLWTDTLTFSTLLSQGKGDATPSAEPQPASVPSTEVRWFTQSFPSANVAALGKTADLRAFSVSLVVYSAWSLMKQAVMAFWKTKV